MRGSAGDGHIYKVWLNGEHVENDATKAVSILGLGYVDRIRKDSDGHPVLNRTLTEVEQYRVWGRVRMEVVR